jgi:hypothetical protein
LGRWKASEDLLFRGDSRDGVQLPTPGASDSIVRHILYLDGFGRPTPYLSTSEVRDVAARFASSGGRVYTTAVPGWAAHGVKHISQSELLQLLTGKGKGKASWNNALEVMQARRHAEESAEHLASFCDVTCAPEELRGVVDG